MRDGLIIVVRRGENSDAALLPNIERSAARAFEEVSGLGWTPGNFVISVEDHLISIARGTLWVTEVNGRIAGFLAANPAGNELHIDELNVHFDHQRSGIGRRLIAGGPGSCAPCLSCCDYAHHIPRCAVEWTLLCEYGF